MAKLRIQLLSDMCMGNGESAGNSIDSDICTDGYGFPYIPGRRITGCLRDTAVMLGEYGLAEANADNIAAIFGNAYGVEGKLYVDNAYLPGIESMHKRIQTLQSSGKSYLQQQSSEEKIVRLYTSVRGQTRIGAEGKAEDGSLRFVRVLNEYDPMTEERKPLVFVCHIDDSCLNAEQSVLLAKTCKALRHMGMDRNRGMGNVALSLESDDADMISKVDRVKPGQTKEESDYGNEEEIRFSYQLAFQSPITMQEYLQTGDQINARSIIGAFSREYLAQFHEADETFGQLFLDGSVRWSACTPVINGLSSVSAPDMLVKLKNGQGKLINSFAGSDTDWKRKKPKTLDDYYAAFDERAGVWYVATPESVSNYHNNIHETNADKVKGLYMQDALRQGMLFGGEVTAPARLGPVITTLLSAKRIYLGRSRKTQYGIADIVSFTQKPDAARTIEVSAEEPVFAILKSDLLLLSQTQVVNDAESVRRCISEAAGLIDQCPDGFYDICRYHVLSGYQTMWHMQKPKVQAVRGGSVYCFTGRKGTYPEEILLGEFQQEGMGRIALVPLHVLQENTKIQYGQISTRMVTEDSVAAKKLQDMLLLEAGKTSLQEYAFYFYENNRNGWNDNGQSHGSDRSIGDKHDQGGKLTDIPCGRLRQMLQEARTISEFWEMVESMKTSDVSSESKGKKAVSKRLLTAFYGEDHRRVDWGRLLRDKDLTDEICQGSNRSVRERLEQYWREPMFTLLHMVHYQKGGDRA